MHSFYVLIISTSICYAIYHVTLFSSFFSEKLPVNLIRLLDHLGSIKDQFKDAIVMADPMADDQLGVPLWLPIKTTLNQVRKTTFPEVKFMDSHLALYKEYTELENK